MLETFLRLLEKQTRLYPLNPLSLFLADFPLLKIGHINLK